MVLPGLGATSAMSVAHRDLPLSQRWVDWIPPRPDEDFRAFARRFGATFEWGERDVLVGISFGGTVALELARRRPPRGVVLLGSPLRAKDVAPEIRAAGPLAPFVPEAAVSIPLVPAPVLKFYFGVETAEHLDLLLSMARALGVETMRQLARLALSIEEEVTCRVPTLAIRGTADRIVPFRADRADVAIEGAGHLPSLTHPRLVEDAILRFVQRRDAGTRP